MKKYDLGLLDPAWLYNDNKGNDPALGGKTYAMLSDQEMKAISLYKAFNDNAVLLVWVTMPKLADGSAVDIIKAWGFKPVTVAFTWLKTNKNTKELTAENIYSGLGHYTNGNQEVMILARRGKALPRINKNVKQVIIAPLSKHSAKPQEQYTRIQALYGDVNKIELFARAVNPPPSDWDAIDLEYNNTDIREWIKQYD